MVRASALYMVIVFALIIGLFCAALVLAAYFYREQDQMKTRYTRLQDSNTSGINILLASPDSLYFIHKKLSLFDTGIDSVELTRQPWGIFDVGVSRAFINKDTLTRAFIFASAIDSSKWAALYVNDEDRGIGIAGKSAIEGPVFLPKAGIKKTYIYDRGYTGDDRLVQGKIYNSERKLPPLNLERLKLLGDNFKTNSMADTAGETADSLENSFLNSTRYLNFGRKVYTLTNRVFSGNIILRSDTTLIIDSSAKLNHVLVFAKAVVIKSGFRGTCQVFATDSISIQKNCRFDYPSGIGLVNTQVKGIVRPISISIGERTLIQGALFIYRQESGEVLPMIHLARNTTVEGQVYSQGMIKYEGGFRVAGSLFTRRFIIQKDYGLTENVLLDVGISTAKLSRDYLSSTLFPVCTNNKKILLWLGKD